MPKPKKQEAPSAADKAAAKQAITTEKDAKREIAVSKMDKLAPEIIAKLEKALKNDKVADDMRLSASLRMAEAKKIAEEGGASFKDWFEKNIPAELMSYENGRKLAVVGSAKDPVAALADLRAGAAKRNKKHRAGKKAAAGKPAGKQGTTLNDPFKNATEAFDRLDDKASLSLIESRAKKNGMVVMSATDAKALRSMENGNLDGVKKAFGALKASDKMAFVKWAANEIGANVVDDFTAGVATKAGASLPADGKMPEMPANLKRKQPAATA